MAGYEEPPQLSQENLPQPDPIVLELNRLQNQLKEKDRELGIAYAEIKALKSTEALKDKALDELRSDVNRLDWKLVATQNLLEQKNLEIKKLIDEKKDALAAQYAAEAALRRLHTRQKDDDYFPIESIIAPLEAEIKMYKNEISTLQEDKKALERLTRSKESALVEAEKILRSALERALIVEEVQNENFELRRQIEICQEENKILEKTNRQKVVEVEKLSQTIKELEDAILAGGAAANAVRDYQRQISELHDENRTLERELARAKVSANRIATVVANEWKDESDKVMPVKQWLEERRLLQAEMQRLRDKLAVSERTARAEAQLKEKLKLRLQTLEEGLKNASVLHSKTDKSSNILGFLTKNSGLKRRSSSLPRASIATKSSPLWHQIKADEVAGPDSSETRHASEEIIPRNIWPSKSMVTDRRGKENAQMEANIGNHITKQGNNVKAATEIKTTEETAICNSEDMVSGFLYDRLQNEVINLRRSCEKKDKCLSAKDQEIEALMKKVAALTKALEVETKKVKRELANRKKEGALAKMNDNKKKGSTHLAKRVLL